MSLQVKSFLFYSDTSKNNVHNGKSIILFTINIEKWCFIYVGVVRSIYFSLICILFSISYVIDFPVFLYIHLYYFTWQLQQVSFITSIASLWRINSPNEIICQNTQECIWNKWSSVKPECSAKYLQQDDSALGFYLPINKTILILLPSLPEWHASAFQNTMFKTKLIQ